MGAAARLSPSELSRIERALVPGVGLLTLSEVCAVVGLDLAARAYPGGRSVRDARHAALLGRLMARLHPSLRWSTEVPLPITGDQRAWDALIRGDGWRYGVEAELNPMDGQALLRRLALKQRDGMVDGVILLLPETRQTRAFRREFADLLTSDFPIPGRLAFERLAAGGSPAWQQRRRPVIRPGRSAHGAEPGSAPVAIGIPDLLQSLNEPTYSVGSASPAKRAASTL